MEPINVVVFNGSLETFKVWEILSWEGLPA